MSYRVEIDKINPDDWHRELTHFSDASIYQTWSYGEVRWGRPSLSHAVVYDGDEVVGLAQVTIKKIPLINSGIAYLPWGPVWKRIGRPETLETLEKNLAALHDEYVHRRRLLPRVMPSQGNIGAEEVRKRYLANGFRPVPQASPYRTLVLDLTPGLDKLRANLRANWRNQLKAAENRNLAIVQGSDETLFPMLIDIYDKMKQRKGFSSQIDIGDFYAAQRLLRPYLRIKIMVCYADRVPLAAIACAVVGASAIYILGATSHEGLKFNASNLVHWLMIDWLKSCGVNTYDLGGIDPAGNPSVYHFKKGLAGKQGIEVEFIGQFEACVHPTSRFAVRAGDYVKRIATSIRRGLPATAINLRR